MDFLYLLAADPQQAVTVSDGIFKYICGGMATGMAAMGYALLQLYKDVKSTPDKIKVAEDTIRDKYDKVIADKEAAHKYEIKKAEEERDRYRREKEQLFREQLDDAKDEVKSFSEQADSLKAMFANDLVPVQAQVVEVLKYCKSAIDRAQRKRT